MNLEQVGWNPALEFYLEQTDVSHPLAGRVCRLDRGRCRLLTREGERGAIWTTPLDVVGDKPVERLAGQLPQAFTGAGERGPAAQRLRAADLRAADLGQGPQVAAGSPQVPLIAARNLVLTSGI